MHGSLVLGVAQRTLLQILLFRLSSLGPIVVVALLLPARVVVWHLLVGLVAVLELLLADGLRHLHVAIIVLVQDAGLEQAIDLGLDNLVLLNLLRH